MQATVWDVHTRCDLSRRYVGSHVYAVERLVAAIAGVRAPFQWVDGPLVQAMKQGDMLLIDELNLADDAVLERLNSVLEPGRTLTLAERGGAGAEVIVAHPAFRCCGCRAQGGAHRSQGKPELHA